MGGSSSKPDAQKRRLVFQVGDQRHEIDAASVFEVITQPHLTRVPNGPRALAGIANLRGSPVPVLSMRKLLQEPDPSLTQNGKIIVYDHGGTVGLLVDDVVRLSADLTAMPLQGLSDLLDAAFTVNRKVSSERTTHASRDLEARTTARLTALLTFKVSGQLYGLPLDHIREVTTPAGDIAIIPNAADAVIGLLPTRDGVLPLVSLASLLGLNIDQPIKAGSRIIVVEHEGSRIGLVVDAMDVIRRLSDEVIDPVPAVLQRGRGDAQLEAIGRIADGGLLVSILSSKKLFRHHAVAEAVNRNTGAEPMDKTAPETVEAVEQFLLFLLGDEQYGLPIASVDEVIHVPDAVTRMPGAPTFVMGVINLRGKAVPLIDQRVRFDTPVSASKAISKARAIIVTLGGLQAGFVVDAVAEVKALSQSALSAAPEFTSDRTDVFDRVGHVETDGRMILLIDPKALLTRAEQDIVAALTVKNSTVASP